MDEYLFAILIVLKGKGPGLQSEPFQFLVYSYPPIGISRGSPRAS